jgi:hypothetical protein
MDVGLEDGLSRFCNARSYGISPRKRIALKDFLGLTQAR